MTQPDPALRAILYEAFASPIGLLCSAVPNLDAARQKLYATRRLLADSRLDSLQFRASPFEDGNLVIVKSTILVEKKDEEIPTS